MPQISDDEGQNLRPRPGQERELVVGDADSAEKTTYVTGRGTEPEARKGADRPSASVPSGGVSPVAVVVGVLVVAAALVYLLGAFR